ncbi:MAG: hypothetical protein WC451_01560 [Patescibacteria group bacterium]
MVSIWEKLFEKFQIKRSSILSGIKILTSEEKKVEVKLENCVVNIVNPHYAKGEEKQVIDDFITSSFSRRMEFIEPSADLTCLDYAKISSDQEYQSIVGFFRNRLPQVDLNLLETALYLRKVYKSGDRERCKLLKTQIISRYGTRGANLSNLCTAGYLENSIIPLFKELDKEKWLEPEKFRSIFYDLIDSYPTAVFVYQGMTDDDINNKIFKKIRENVEFGLLYLTIHGIGKDNIKTVKRVLQRITSESLGKLINEEILGDSIKARVELSPIGNNELPSSLE